jgi:EpsD family peptidyl-prolyl cis-trans isomerase
MRRIPAISSVFMILLAVIVTGCGKKEEKLQVKHGLAARIDDIKLTEEYVDAKFEALGDAEKKMFEGIDGKSRFVDKLIEERILYREAIAKNLHNDEEIREQIEQSERNVLLSYYYQNEVVAKIEVGDDEVKEYYDANQEEFKTRALMRAQHIFSEDSMKCVRWKKRLEAGENFSKIAKEESEDQMTAIVSGSLGYFNPGGYIKSIGFSQTFSAAVEDLEVGDISGVIAYEKGYSIVKINEKVPSKIQPLAEVHKQIVDKLRGRKAKKAYRAEVERLFEKYQPVNYLHERLLESLRSPEELWEIAQMENDPYKRVQYYRDLVTRHPDHKYAPQALFMIGFVYAEELRDLVMARRAFDELLDEYPNNDIVESATWMIENLDKPHPRFDSVESMKEYIEDNPGSSTEKE